MKKIKYILEEIELNLDPNNERFSKYCEDLNNYMELTKKELEYWKERCRLAEAVFAEPKIGRQFHTEKRDHAKFLTDNGHKPY